MKTKPDTRFMVLLALYSEYTRDDGDFNRITASVLDMEPQVFGWALYRLQTEGLIDGCKFQPPHPQNASALMGVLRDNLRMTGEGVRRCDELLGCDGNARDTMKRQLLADFFTGTGAGVLAGLILRAL